MQTENDTTKPEDSPQQEAGEGCSVATCSLLLGLIALGDRESSNGKFRVTLDYDNYQDGARVLDGDGNVMGECYDMFLPTPDDENGTVRQFTTAIHRAIQANA
jgi:hypothetical protein